MLATLGGVHTNLHDFDPRRGHREPPCGVAIQAFSTVQPAHSERRTVKNWTLMTADAHRLYAGFGFCPAEANGNWMTLDRAPIEGV